MDPQTAEAQQDPGGRTDNVVPPPAQTRSSISSLLFLTFILFLMTGGGNEDIANSSKIQYRDVLESLTYQQSNYTAWLNGTESNFTLPPEDPTLAPLVQSMIPPPSLGPQLSYYRNLSGFISGPSRYHNLSVLQNLSIDHSTAKPWQTFVEHFVAHSNITFSTLAENIGTYNWTGINKATMSLLELRGKESDEIASDSAENVVVFMHGKLELSNPSENVDLRFQVDGVHVPDNGSFVGFATPKGRYADLRDLPSLVPAHVRNATAHVVAPELERKIARIRAIIDGGGSVDADTSLNDKFDDASLPTCHFTFHFQLQPSTLSRRLMGDLESELDNPTGISTTRAPYILLDAVLISKSCAIMIELRDARGIKVQRFWRKATTYAGCSFLVYLVLLTLLARQVESNSSRTPVGLSRISRWSFVAQAGADAISFVGHLTFGIFSENRASLSLIAPGFLACILLVYQTQYAILINQIQGPEDTALREARIRASPAETASDPQSTTGRADISTRFLGVLRSRFTLEPQTRFWFLVVISMVFFFNLIFSPILALFAVGTIYSLLWTPQIFRSARRGSRSALNKEYLVGSTVCRMFFALYIFACPENVLGVDPSLYIWLIVGLIVLQVLIIIGQDWFGPSFFLPKGWVTVDIYDYHPPIPAPDSESPKHTLGDCSICMEPILIHSDLSSGVNKTTVAPLIPSTSASMRRLYAVAPCHHTFHTDCLEQWLAIKNICPQCRRPLPPL